MSELSDLDQLIDEPSRPARRLNPGLVKNGKRFFLEGYGRKVNSLGQRARSSSTKRKVKITLAKVGGA